ALPRPRRRRGSRAVGRLLHRRRRPSADGRLTVVHLWVDASAGIAGDMLLGALLDAGASLASVTAAVSAVVPGEVAVRSNTGARGGLRALKADGFSRLA